MPVERRGWVIAFEIGSTGNGRNPIFNGRRQPSCGGTSRMTRECQVRICERLGVKFPGPTRPTRKRLAARTASANWGRPEFEPPWIGQPHVTALTINRLTEREVGAIIDRIVGNKQLPARIRQDIIERTDGIPLFVEEMTKAVLEAESEGAAEHVAAAVPSPVRAVPASLHASLMARLDHSAPPRKWRRSAPR